MDLSVQLQWLLDYHEKTRATLSRETGIPPTTIQSIFDRKGSTNFLSLLKIADYFKISPFFFAPDNEPNRQSFEAAQQVYAFGRENAVKKNELETSLEFDLPNPVKGDPSAHVESDVLLVRNQLPLTGNEFVEMEVQTDKMHPKYKMGKHILVMRDASKDIGDSCVFEYHGKLVLRCIGNGQLVCFNLRYPAVNYTSAYNYFGKVIAALDL